MLFPTVNRRFIFRRRAGLKFALALFATAAAAEPSRGQTLVEYARETGSGNSNVGLATTPASGEVLWGNSFATQPGGETITAISVAFGTATAGTPVRLVLLSDPNGDGNPADGTLLAEGRGEVANPRSNTFNHYSIPPTTVSGSFFVGVIFPFTSADRPARQALGTPNGGWSWLFAAPQIDTSALASAPITRGPGAIAGTWLVRASGIPSAPARCSIADLNADGTLDGNDFVLFINSFALGDLSVDALADVNLDGIIDGSDFVSFINNFALGC